jgi:hypothetical protein
VHGTFALGVAVVMCGLSLQFVQADSGHGQTLSAIARSAPSADRASLDGAIGLSATATGIWNKALAIPGIASLPYYGGHSVLTSISCATAGNCSAGGYYAGNDADNAFLVDEVNGVWGKAHVVPNIANLSGVDTSEVLTTSCWAAGYCSAGGFFNVAPYWNSRAFVVDEVNGVWGQAKPVQVPADTPANVYGSVTTMISCAPGAATSAGGVCSAVGYIGRDGWDNDDCPDSFVMNRVSGAWKPYGLKPYSAILPGTPPGTWADCSQALAVSCPSAASCAAGGWHGTSQEWQTSDLNWHWDPASALLYSETAGAWGGPADVSGMAAYSPQGFMTDTAITQAVSCPATGTCTAGGFYAPGEGDSLATPAGSREGFLVEEANGVWGSEVALGSLSSINEISCGSTTSCVAVGTGVALLSSAAIVEKKSGTWGKPFVVPGMAGKTAGVSSVSCPTAGGCVAGGSYTDASGHTQAFVVREAGGAWGQAQVVPGSVALNAGNSAGVVAVSCTKTTTCSAVGNDTDATEHPQGFVENENTGGDTSTTLVTSNASVHYGTPVTYTATVTPSDNLGTVTFLDGGTAITGCRGVVLVSAKATCPGRKPPVGSHTITAAYSGDVAYGPSSSPQITEKVSRAATATLLTSSVAAGVYNTSVTFTAKVSPSDNRGSVTFADTTAKTDLCDSVSIAKAVARCTVTISWVGTHTVSASYSGDTSYLGSRATLSQLSKKHPTALTLTSTKNPATMGNKWSESYTATLKPTDYGGTITFFDGGTAITGCKGKSLTVGTPSISCSMNSSHVGSNSITATYSGDYGYAGSTSPTLIEVIHKVATTTTIILITEEGNYPLSKITVPLGASTDYYAVVSAYGSGLGKVTFFANKVAIAGCVSMSLRSDEYLSDYVSCVVKATTLGISSITASYSGSSVDLPSTSAAVIQTVVKP